MSEEKIIEIPTDEADVINSVPKEWLNGRHAIYILHNEETMTAYVSDKPILEKLILGEVTEKKQEVKRISKEELDKILGETSSQTGDIITDDELNKLLRKREEEKKA